MKVKNLKSMLLLVAITVVFIGCSKDDEPTIPNPLVGVWEYIDIEPDVFATSTITFNSNKTYTSFASEEHNGVVIFQNSASGTYSIQGKDKIIFHTTYDDKLPDPNVEYDWTVRFKKGQEEKGEYLVFIFDILGDSEKFYKK